MASTAFQKQYRQQTIDGFEQRESLVRKTVTTEAVIKGNEAIFLVADSGGAEAVTRGVNGEIPSRPDNLQQNTATLVEWHDLVKKTRFNIFASQGDQNRIMQMTTQAVINRKMDQDIISALDTTTVTVSNVAQTMSLRLMMHACAILGNNEVPMDGKISALITPAAHAYLMETKEFASADYVNRQPFGDNLTMFVWAGVNFIVHPNLPGKGTAAEKVFVYHMDSIGHAANVGEMDVAVGYREEQDYSYARASIFMGAKLLQADGCVEILHDGSDFAPA